jgi:hypothetical protein
MSCSALQGCEVQLSLLIGHFCRTWRGSHLAGDSPASGEATPPYSEAHVMTSFPLQETLGLCPYVNVSRLILDLSQASVESPWRDYWSGRL